jgi:hypothetical protein
MPTSPLLWLGLPLGLLLPMHLLELLLLLLLPGATTTEAA